MWLLFTCCVRMMSTSARQHSSGHYSHVLFMCFRPQCSHNWPHYDTTWTRHWCTHSACNLRHRLLFGQVCTTNNQHNTAIRHHQNHCCLTLHSSDFTQYEYLEYYYFNNMFIWTPVSEKHEYLQCYYLDKCVHLIAKINPVVVIGITQVCPRETVSHLLHLLHLTESAWTDLLTLYCRTKRNHFRKTQELIRRLQEPCTNGTFRPLLDNDKSNPPKDGILTRKPVVRGRFIDSVFLIKSFSPSFRDQQKVSLQVCLCTVWIYQFLIRLHLLSCDIMHFQIDFKTSDEQWWKLLHFQ